MKLVPLFLLLVFLLTIVCAESSPEVREKEKRKLDIHKPRLQVGTQWLCCNIHSERESQGPLLRARSRGPGMSDFLGLMGRRAIKRMGAIHRLQARREGKRFMDDMFIGLMGKRDTDAETPAMDIYHS